MFRVSKVENSRDFLVLFHNLTTQNRLFLIQTAINNIQGKQHVSSLAECKFIRVYKKTALQLFLRAIHSKVGK